VTIAGIAIAAWPSPSHDDQAARAAVAASESAPPLPQVLPQLVKIERVPGIGRMLTLAPRQLPSCRVYRRGSSAALTIGGANLAVCRDWITAEGETGQAWTLRDPQPGQPRRMTCIFFGADTALYEVDSGGSDPAAALACRNFSLSNLFVEDGPGEQAKRKGMPLPLTGSPSSSSMEPTLHCPKPAVGCEALYADYVVTEVVAPSLLRRGDIVVFRAPPLADLLCEPGDGSSVMKRLIGLPGDVVSEQHGILSVNGRQLKEPYLHDRPTNDRHRGRWRVPNKSYFMVGDSRAASCDSREWGPVPAKDVAGRAWSVLRFRPVAFNSSSSAVRVVTPKLWLDVPSWWRVHRATDPSQSDVHAWDFPVNGLSTDVVADVKHDSARELALSEEAYDLSQNDESDVRLGALYLPGVRGWKVTYFIPADGKRRGSFQEQYFIQREKSTVWLTLTVPTWQRAAYQQGFDRIAASAFPNPDVQTDGGLRFVDPAGDAHGAPDITSLTVRRERSGLLQFTFTFPKVPSTHGTQIAISIDADHSPRTGDTSGFDYWVIDQNGKPSLQAVGKAMKENQMPAPSLKISLRGTNWTAEISPSDLGHTSSFRFYGWTNADFGNVYGDDAPGGKTVLTYTPPTK
jgi:signal peptidase I